MFFARRKIFVDKAAEKQLLSFASEKRREKKMQNEQTERKTKLWLVFRLPEGVQRYAERRSLFIA